MGEKVLAEFSSLVTNTDNKFCMAIICMPFVFTYCYLMKSLAVDNFPL